MLSEELCVCMDVGRCNDCDAAIADLTAGHSTFTYNNPGQVTITQHKYYDRLY